MIGNGWMIIIAGSCLYYAPKAELDKLIEEATAP